MAVSGSDVVATAAAELGDPYLFGATGPDRWDCSSLVQHAYRSHGIELPRTTWDQVEVGQPVDLDQLAVGDLVFSDWGDGPNSHVGLYAGDGRVLEAGVNGVTYTPLDGSYRAHVTAARRVLGGDASSNSLGDRLRSVAGAFAGWATSPVDALNRIGDGVGALADSARAAARLNERILDLILHPQRAILKGLLAIGGLVLIIVGIWLITTELRE